MNAATVLLVCFVMRSYKHLPPKSRVSTLYWWHFRTQGVAISTNWWGGRCEAARWSTSRLTVTLSVRKRLLGVTMLAVAGRSFFSRRWQSRIIEKMFWCNRIGIVKWENKYIRVQERYARQPLFFCVYMYAFIATHTSNNQVILSHSFYLTTPPKPWDWPIPKSTAYPVKWQLNFPDQTTSRKTTLDISIIIALLQLHSYSNGPILRVYLS